MTRVLVTDAQNRNALAAIRNLGARGVHVVASSPNKRAQGFFSRYASEHVVSPAPSDEEAFVEFVVETAAARRLDVVLPVGYVSSTTLSKHKAAVAEHVALPVADWPTMKVASDKGLTLALASRVGVLTPRLYAEPAEVDAFPVVVKETLDSGRVRYVNNETELRRFATDGALIQEYVPGDGVGFFALLDHGDERAIFMHRRIREYPVTGGASTAAESIYDPVLRDLGRRLLHELRWHGVAMVEFKRDARDGSYKLMEINPKFWGSLDLAVVAGVEFPWLAVRMALGEQFPPVVDYRRGARFRWVFDDLMHAVAQPADLPAFFRDFFDDATQQDIRRDDLGPVPLDAITTLGSTVLRATRGTLRHPHGTPDVIRRSGPSRVT